MLFLSDGSSKIRISCFSSPLNGCVRVRMRCEHSLEEPSMVSPFRYFFNEYTNAHPWSNGIIVYKLMHMVSLSFAHKVEFTKISFRLCANTTVLHWSEWITKIQIGSVIIFDYALFCTLTKSTGRHFISLVCKTTMFLLNFQSGCNDVALALKCMHQMHNHFDGFRKANCVHSNFAIARAHKHSNKTLLCHSMQLHSIHPEINWQSLCCYDKILPNRSFGWHGKMRSTLSSVIYSKR